MIEGKLPRLAYIFIYLFHLSQTTFYNFPLFSKKYWNQSKDLEQKELNIRNESYQQYKNKQYYYSLSHSRVQPKGFQLSKDWDILGQIITFCLWEHPGISCF